MNIARNTAKRMLANIEEELKELAQQQQSMNGNKGGTEQYRCGGKVKRHKMPGGDYVPPQLPYENRSPYWPYQAGAQDALNTVKGNYMPTYGQWLLNAGDTLKQGQPNMFQRGAGYNQFDWAHQSYTPPAKNSNPMMIGDYTPNPMNYGQQAIPGRDVLPYKQKWQMVPNAPTTPPVKKVALPVNNTPYNPGPKAPSYTAPGAEPLDLSYNPVDTPKEYNINFSNAQDNPLLTTKFNPAASKAGVAPTQKPGFGAMDVMGMLPGLFNLGAGLFGGKAQKLNSAAYQNPYADQALAAMPTQYRIDPLINEYKNAYANYSRNVRNTGNSRGEMMANLGAGMNQYDTNVGQAYAEKFNKENEYAMRRAQMMNQIGQQQAETRLNVQNMNDQNQAAARNNRMAYLGAAAGDFQKNYLINKQMAGQQNAQDAWLWAIQNQPFMKDWVLGGIDPNNLAGLFNRKGK